MDWKKKFKTPGKQAEFHRHAVNNGVIIACQECKTPFWKVRVVDVEKKKTETENLHADWDYETVWKDLNPTQMKPCPHCGSIEWMQGIIAEGKVFPRPYILGGL